MSYIADNLFMNNTLKLELTEIESPIETANSIGNQSIALSSDEEKKELGQFFTPPDIARFLSSFTKKTVNNTISILDPGCGYCILSLSLIETLIRKHDNIDSIHLLLYDIDESINPDLTKIMTHTRSWLQSKSIEFTYELRLQDFIKDSLNRLQTKTIEFHDFIISNPPFYKVKKSSNLAKTVENKLTGKSNIFTLFMEVCSKLLISDGELLLITPRSFASGSYYKSFRQVFFSCVKLDRVHIFKSRSGIFHQYDILQEIILMKYTKWKENYNIEISSSNTIDDVEADQSFHVDVNTLLKVNDLNRYLYLPLNMKELDILNKMSSLPYHLDDFKIRISTGPVVAHRNTSVLRSKSTNAGTCPMIWLNNIGMMNLDWPMNINKKQYILKSSTNLVLSQNMILLRRFSTKDDKKRLIASPLLRESIEKYQMVGIENKVNYIYCESEEMSKSVVMGLSMLLNSTLYDQYFRILNGTSNVNATEMKSFPLPSIAIIKSLGKLAIESCTGNQNEIDSLIEYNLFEK